MRAKWNESYLYSLRVVWMLLLLSGTALHALSQVPAVESWQVSINGTEFASGGEELSRIGYSAIPAILSKQAYDRLPERAKRDAKPVDRIAWKSVTDRTGNESNRLRLSIRESTRNLYSVTLECS
jgi:hypothetical protein